MNPIIALLKSLDEIDPLQRKPSKAKQNSLAEAKEKREKKGKD